MAVSPFDIDAYLNAGAQGATAATAEAPAAAGIAERFAGYGAKARALMEGGGGWLGKLLSRAPAVGTLAQGALGPDNTPVANAIRMGAGVGALLNPTVGVPLTAGMQAGDLIAGAIGNPAVDAAVAANDIRGPATKEFLARGGNTTTYATPPMPYVPPQAQSGSIPDTSGYGAVSPKPVAAAAAPAEAPPLRGFGGAIMSVLALKQIANKQAGDMARQKLTTDAAAKGAQARKDIAGASIDEATLRAAQLEAARAGATPGSVGGVLGRRAQTHDSSVFFPGMTPKDPVIVGNKATGAVTQKMARPALTEANIQATMKAQKLSREQALSAYEAQGYDTSRTGPRLLATDAQRATTAAQQAELDALPPDVRARLLRGQ